MTTANRIIVPLVALTFFGMLAIGLAFRVAPADSSGNIDSSVVDGATPTDSTDVGPSASDDGLGSGSGQGTMFGGPTSTSRNQDRERSAPGEPGPDGSGGPGRGTAPATGARAMSSRPPVGCH